MIAEAGPPPAGLEQRQQAVEAARPSAAHRRGVPGLLGVESLQDLVDQDAEPLVDRGLLGDRRRPERTCT